MRTDALDRFDTRLELHFSCAQIKEMMELEQIEFSGCIPIGARLASDAARSG